MEPRVLIIVLILALAWTSAVIYSKWRFPLLPCAVCGGGGKHFEPWIIAWLCFRRVRAFRLCDNCGGGAKVPRSRRRK